MAQNPKPHPADAGAQFKFRSFEVSDSVLGLPVFRSLLENFRQFIDQDFHDQPGSIQWQIDRKFSG